MGDPLNEGVPGNDFDEGGDAACWAHLMCDKCGGITEPGVMHRCEGDEDGIPTRSTT